MIFDDADFDLLRADQTMDLHLHEVHLPRSNKEHVVLVLRFCGDGNAGWTNAMLKMPQHATGDAAQDWLAEQVAKYGIVGWRNVAKKGAPDADGKETLEAIPYNAERGADLLAQLRRVKRSDLLDRVLSTVRFAPNFRPKQVDDGDLGNG